VPLGVPVRASIGFFVVVSVCLFAAGCGPSPSDFDGSLPDGAPPDGHCIGPNGEDLGPLETPLDACEVADEHPDDPIAVAACLGYAPFVRGDFELPFDFLIGDVTARRFGVSALSHLWEGYVESLKVHALLGYRAFARVGNAAAFLTAEELALLESLNDVTVPALFCDRYDLPAGYIPLLEDTLAQGGYDATHVLLALFWIRELGCTSPVDEAFYEDVLTVVAEIIDDWHEYTSDMEIEAAVFLAYLGEEARIPEGFAEGLAANQRSDGSWSDIPEDDPLGDPQRGHTTGLALWYLHEVLFPGRETTMVTRCVR
jgi:hypothetical protein